jgi:hypothetical protein
MVRDVSTESTADIMVEYSTEHNISPDIFIFRLHQHTRHASQELEVLCFHFTTFSITLDTGPIGRYHRTAKRRVLSVSSYGTAAVIYIVPEVAHRVLHIGSYHSTANGRVLIVNAYGTAIFIYIVPEIAT